MQGNWAWLSYSAFSFVLALTLVIVAVIISAYWSWCGTTPDAWSMQRFQWLLWFAQLFLILGILGFLLERRGFMNRVGAQFSEDLVSPRR
jgi:uncharacterized membrane protein YphA (DoxX/SURF4 family)